MTAWITDRLPTEADGDRDGDVAMRAHPGKETWVFVHWSQVNPGNSWKRTDYWEPPAQPAPPAVVPSPPADQGGKAMTKQHPITPPPELVEQWVAEIWHEGTPVCVAAGDFHIATQAARWGADRQLEACVGYVDTHVSGNRARALRAAMRPKQPSLKEQALEALGPEPPPENSPTGDSYLNGGAIERHRTIRRALEALPND